ncbi:MAG: hypothetical protein VKI63_02030 [Cyanobium sp.]|nr:hypothetical protein [Cyanobium sp.]
MATRTKTQNSPSWRDRLADIANGTRIRATKEERKTLRLAIHAAANLLLVGADEQVVDRVTNEILDRRLTDDSSGGTADTLLGRAVIETLTGKPAPAFLPRAGEVARALIDAQANLQLVGIDDTDAARNLTDRIVREGLRGTRAKAALQEVVGPVVKQAEAAQQGGSEPAAATGTEETAPRQPAASALHDLPRAKAPGTTPTNESVTPATTAPAPGPGTPAPAEASQPAPSQPSADPGNATSGVITGTLHNINNNADGSGTYDVTLTYPDGSTELRHVTVNADGSSTITHGDGSTESYPPGSTGMPPDSAEGQTSVVNQDSDGDGKNDTATYGSEDDSGEDDDDDNGDGDSGTADGDENQNPNGEDGTDSNESSADQPAASGTPNPEAQETGSGFGLHEATGGRLGGDAARRQQDRLDLLIQGGGAAGPRAGEGQASGVLLTPEERAHAERLLGVKAGGGITTPSPLEKGGTAITERDLKELKLRGNGGAGTPDVVVSPVIQPPRSPLAPPAGVPGAGGDPITGLGAVRAVPSLPTFQRSAALQRVKALPGEAVPATSPSAAPLNFGAAGFSQAAADVFSRQAGGLPGAEMNLRGLVTFQAAPLLA